MKETDARQHIERGVEQVFGAAARLTNAELAMVRAIWESTDPVLRDVAWAKAKARIRRSGRLDLLSQASARMAEWTNGVWPVAGTAAGSMLGADLNTGADTGTVRRSAMAPVLDAAVAVIAADGLTDEDRQVLMQPLRSVAAKHAGTRV